MPKHEVIYQDNAIPNGFDTYSILLIPDYRWLDEISMDDQYKLFINFKRFGDAIGANHLACWPFNTEIGPYRPLIDQEFFAVIYGSVHSNEEVAKFISNYFSNVDADWIKDYGGYDVLRAKHFCVRYGLDFNSGPYIAFFDSRPELPVLYHEERHLPRCASSNPPTRPTFLVKFADMSIDQVLDTLNELEYELLKDNPNINKLNVISLMKKLEIWCLRIAGSIGKSAIIVKDIKDAVALTPPIF